jgi:hypothetical protein
MAWCIHNTHKTHFCIFAVSLVYRANNFFSSAFGARSCPFFPFESPSRSVLLSLQVNTDMITSFDAESDHATRVSMTLPILLMILLLSL